MRFLKFNILGEIWCRIAHGHVMVCFGKERGEMWYMCARCNKCEIFPCVLDNVN